MQSGGEVGRVRELGERHMVLGRDIGRRCGAEDSGEEQRAVRRIFGNGRRGTGWRRGTEGVGEGQRAVERVWERWEGHRVVGRGREGWGRVLDGG